MRVVKKLILFVSIFTIISLMVLTSCARQTFVKFEDGYGSVLLEIPGLKENIPYYPVSSALDDEGNIYILDQISTAGSVFVFDKNYNFKEKFAPHGGIEQENVDIAVDKEGAVYVADLGMGEIIKYKNEKEVKRIKPDDSFFPRAIAVNSKNELIVLSYDKVYVFNSEGEILRKFGESGRGKGQFMTYGSEFYIGPLGIAVDEQDNIYVADTLNKRLQQFTPDGAFTKDYPLEDEPQDVAVNEEGIFALLKNKIVKIDFKKGIIKEFYKIAQNNEDFSFSSLFGKKDKLVICLPDDKGVVFFEKGKEVKVIKNNDKENFLFPHHVNGDKEHIIVVSGNFYEKTGKVQVFKRDGSFLYNLSLPGEDFIKPVDAVIIKDKIYVLDLDRVHIFDKNGNYIKSFGERGEEEGKLGVFDNYGDLMGPMDIASGEDNNLYIADTFNDRINIYDANGNFLRQIQIQEPKEITFDEKGNMYVLRNGIFSLVKWDGMNFKEVLNDRFKELFYEDERNPEDSGVQGIAVKNGKIYLSNTGNHKIEVFDLKGNHIESIGGFGFEKGRFNTPKGIFIDNEDNLIVADSGNHRLILLKKGR